MLPLHFRVMRARDGAAGRRAEKNSRAAPGVNINEDHVRPLLCLGEILGRGGLAVERRVSWPEGQDYEQSPKRWRKDKKDCAGIAFAALSMSFLGDGCSLCFRDGLLLCHGALRRRLENSSRAQRGDEEIVWRWAVAKLLRRWALRGRRAALDIFGRWAVAVERRSSWRQAERKAAGPLRASAN